MTVLAICGWETGDYRVALTSSGTFSVQSTTKRTGGYALRCNPTTTARGYVSVGIWRGTTGIRYTLNCATLYARYYFRVATLPSAGSEEIYYAMDSTVLKFALRITSAGKLQAYSNNGTSQLGSDGTTTINTNTWYRIEVKSGTDAGANAPYEVLIDGVSELSGVGTLGANNHNYACFGKVVDRNGRSVDYYYDDICLDDAAYPGAGQIEIMQPNADGNYTTWTASTGNKWDCVDEVPYSNTDYVQSTLTSGNAYTAALESAANAGISGTIKAASMILGICRAAASNGSIRLRFRSNTTDSSTGTSFATTSTEQFMGMIFLVDPATSASWTTAGLDGAEVGVVEYSTTYKTNCYGAYLEVDFVPAVDQTVNAVAMTATAEMPAPTVTATGGGATVTVPAAATATAAMPTATVTGSSTVTVPAAATATAAMLTPTVSARVTVTVPEMEATAQMPTPTVTARSTVTAVAATATAAMPTPSVGVVANATVTAVIMVATAAMPIPSVSATSTVTAVKATATAAMPTPTVSGGASATVLAVAAAATASMPTPAAYAGSRVTAVSMTATAAMPTPVVTAVSAADALVMAVCMRATAAMPTPWPFALLAQRFLTVQARALILSMNGRTLEMVADERDLCVSVPGRSLEVTADEREFEFYV